MILILGYFIMTGCIMYKNKQNAIRPDDLSPSDIEQMDDSKKASNVTTLPPEAKKLKRKMGLKLLIPPIMTIQERISEYQRQGILVASGMFGIVIRDPLDSSVLIKYMGKGYEAAKSESKYFNQFYGENSSEVYRDSEGDVFLRMLKVPGIPLSEVPLEQLPNNAKELYLKLVADLGDASIYHRDLHFSNVMYDVENNKFWPIDFEDVRDCRDEHNLSCNERDISSFEQKIESLGVEPNML